SLFGCDGIARWQLKELETPTGIQLLPGNRILYGDANSSLRLRALSGKPKPPARLIEQGLDGKVLWHHELKESRGSFFRRLANGNTYVAHSDGGLEVTPDHQEVLLAVFGKSRFSGSYLVRLCHLRRNTFLDRHEFMQQLLDGLEA